MADAVIETSNLRTHLTASGIAAGPGARLVGFYVHSTTAGTIQLRHGQVIGATAVGGVITPGVGFHPYPATFPLGLFAEIGGTLDVAFLYDRGA